MLTVCVIGRNEAKRLPALIESLVPLRERGIADEMIYVDSASTDASVAIAGGFFDRVLVLEDVPELCASAGRHAGTLAARGDWILYLDGDMVLCPEFLPVLARIVAEPAGLTGWTGRIPHHYDDGKVRPNPKGYRTDGEVVAHIGTGFLLPKAPVMEAGNWRACLFSNEEIDLYSRFRAVGGMVRFVDVPMAIHRMPAVPRWKKLIGLFRPGPPYGKQFYGFGQLIRARLAEGSLGALARFHPYPFVYWAVLALTLCALALGGVQAALPILAAGTGFIAYAKGWHYPVLYVAQIVQLPIGWRRYRADFRPRVARVIERTAEPVP